MTLQTRLTCPRYYAIDGAHPAEYAAQWGDGTRDGTRFYNCCDCTALGRTIATASWSRADWLAFAQAIESLAKRDWINEDDRPKLAKLREWALYESIDAPH